MQTFIETIREELRAIDLTKCKQPDIPIDSSCNVVGEAPDELKRLFALYYLYADKLDKAYSHFLSLEKYEGIEGEIRDFLYTVQKQQLVFDLVKLSYVHYFPELEFKTDTVISRNWKIVWTKSNEKDVIKKFIECLLLDKFQSHEQPAYSGSISPTLN